MPDSASADAVLEDRLNRQIPSSPSTGTTGSHTDESSNLQSTDDTEAATDVDRTGSFPDSSVVCEGHHTSMALLIPAAFLTMVAVAGVAGAQIDREVEVAAATNMEPVVEADAQSQNGTSQPG